jgi:hypothetical protein
MEYYLFAGSKYYPAGGATDFVGSFGSPQAAKDGRPADCDWAHVATEELGRLVILVEWKSPLYGGSGRWEEPDGKA